MNSIQCAYAPVNLWTHTQKHCISIGEIAKCQLVISSPGLSLPQPALALFYRLGNFGSICFRCLEKKTFPLFDSAVCWETCKRSWQKSLRSVSSCYTERLYGGGGGGGAVHLLGVLVGDAIGVCRRMRIQKWGTLLILVGLVRVGCCRAGTEFKREVIACS